MKYTVARQRVRKNIKTRKMASAWIANNQEIAVEEGRIFSEAWHGITHDENAMKY